jgi:hypothetical protein
MLTDGRSKPCGVAGWPGSRPGPLKCIFSIDSWLDLVKKKSSILNLVSALCGITPIKKQPSS